MTALLHFDKLFQIPLILAHGISGISYRDMIEAFMAADPGALSDDRRRSTPSSTARRKSIQQGGSEYVFSKEYLGIYWPADEYIFVKLTAEGKFDAFYAEAGKLAGRDRERPRLRPADGHHRRGDPAQPCAGPPAVRQATT